MATVEKRNCSGNQWFVYIQAYRCYGTDQLKSEPTLQTMTDSVYSHRRRKNFFGNYYLIVFGEKLLHWRINREYISVFQGIKWLNMPA